MVFPSDFELDPRGDEEENEEDREEWLDEVEDEYIAQGDISPSETADGHNPDLDDEDEFENAFDEAMHEEDLE